MLTSSLLCSALLIAVPLRKELNEGWKFKQARLSNWYPATVPGVVHTDLMDNKIIEDPFFRLNERGMQWIDKEDWIYQTTFQLTPEMMGRENIDLIFKGLDTYADVYLNEKKILEANNMFREWKTSIKPDLKPGENVLKIYFHSPIKVDIPKWDALPYQYEAGNDQSENGGVFNKKVSVFARKAGYHYGWDWAPASSPPASGGLYMWKPGIMPESTMSSSASRKSAKAVHPSSEKWRYWQTRR